MWETIWQWLSQPSNQRLILAAVIAFGLGMVLGRRFRSKDAKGKSSARHGDEAFFKGVRYILSNDHDQAIEEFAKSVHVNSETIETYIALGNLYRSKGEIDRAIRIRQSIILRPNIDEQMRLQALFDLGLDFKKGGVLNRALKIFQEVLQKAPSDVRTLREVERIYEELKDWENAYQSRQKIARLTPGDHRHIMAHHLVERGKVLQEAGNPKAAKSFFHRAVSTHGGCVDAFLHLGDIFFDAGEYKKAISAWKNVVKVAPQFTFLAYRRLEGAYSTMKNLKPVEEFLRECAASNSDAFTHMALARYLYNDRDVQGALREIGSALELEPTFWEARRFRAEILLDQRRNEEALADYGELIRHLNMPYLNFQCRQCGFEPSELMWQCPRCKTWDSIHLMEPPREPSVTPASEHQALSPRLELNGER